jgi:hypothetical protein
MAILIQHKERAMFYQVFSGAYDLQIVKRYPTRQDRQNEADLMLTTYNIYSRPMSYGEMRTAQKAGSIQRNQFARTWKRMLVKRIRASV